MTAIDIAAYVIIGVWVVCTPFAEVGCKPWRLTPSSFLARIDTVLLVPLCSPGIVLSRLINGRWPA